MTTLNPRRAERRARRQHGFSLVELLVGIGVGLLSTVVIATILSNSERQKRSNSSGTDAQIAGSLALHELDRSLRDAGYGLTTDMGAMGCTLQARFVAGTNLAGAPANLEPARITVDPNGAPSTLRLMRSTATGFSLPAKMKSPLFDPAETSGTVRSTVVVSSTLGMAANDLLAVVTPPANADTGLGACVVFQANTMQPNLRDITRTEGQPWNGAGDLAKATVDQYVVNLGELEVVTYAVTQAKNASGAATSQNQLQATRYSLRDRTSTMQVVQTGVVDLKAYYGKDTNNDGIVDTYDTTTPTTATGWSQVRSIRLAVLARSDQYEKEVVTSAAPQWNVGKGITVSGATDCGTSKCVDMNAKAGDTGTDWQHYRYKLFDLVSPLRNQLWRSDMTVPPLAPPSTPASGA